MAPDPELTARLRAALSTTDGITEKRMFGSDAFLLHGHLLAAASGRGGVMLRVDPAAGPELAGHEHVRPFEMRGRELAGWLLAGEAAVRTEAELHAWLGHALAFVATLPARR